MKKINLFIVSITSFLVLMFSVSAAPAASLSVSRSSIPNGSKVTASVTVSNTAAWNIKITSSGSTNGCTNSWADATSNGSNTTKTFSTTCTATSTGTISFILSGDITSADGSNINVSGTKTVSVTEPVPASTINTLTSLGVAGYSLSPAFDAEVLNYSTTVPSTVSQITITGAKRDASSSVRGLGTFNIEEGLNKFSVVVTAESGSTRTYTINVTQEDVNPIKVMIDNKEYTVVKTSKDLEIPNNFVEATTTVNDQEVLCFKNEVTNIIIVALKDDEGNISYYNYDNGNYSKYIEMSSNPVIINILDVDSVPYKGFNKSTVTINNEQVNAFKYKDLGKYYLIYGMDVNTGAKNYYLYDSINNTYQVFNEDLFNSLSEVENDANIYLYMLIGAAVLIFLCIIIILSLLKRNNKKAKEIKKEKQEEIKNEKKNNTKNKKEVDKKEKATTKKNNKKKKVKEDSEYYNILEDE